MQIGHEMNICKWNECIFFYYLNHDSRKIVIYVKDNGS